MFVFPDHYPPPGNMISDVAGVWGGDLIEEWALKLGLPRPMMQVGNLSLILVIVSVSVCGLNMLTSTVARTHWALRHDTIFTLKPDPIYVTPPHFDSTLCSTL